MVISIMYTEKPLHANSVGELWIDTSPNIKTNKYGKKLQYNQLKEWDGEKWKKLGEIPSGLTLAATKKFS